LKDIFSDLLYSLKQTLPKKDSPKKERDESTSKLKTAVSHRRIGPAVVSNSNFSLDYSKDYLNKSVHFEPEDYKKKMNINHLDCQLSMNSTRRGEKGHSRRGSMVYSSVSDLFTMKESVKTSQKGVFLHKLDFQLPCKNLILTVFSQLRCVHYKK